MTFILFVLFHVNSYHSLLLCLFSSRYRAPPSPILPHGVGALYSPSASFQSLLANISAAQHSAQHSAHQSAGKPITSHSEFLTSIAASSPPLSPPISVTAGGNNSTSGSASPPDDRRSSSIAALRLKAREHEIRLEMLRQNGHNDIISWIRCAFNGSENKLSNYLNRRRFGQLHNFWIKLDVKNNWLMLWYRDRIRIRQSTFFWLLNKFTK